MAKKAFKPSKGQFLITVDGMKIKIEIGSPTTNKDMVFASTGFYSHMVDIMKEGGVDKIPGHEEITMGYMKMLAVTLGKDKVMELLKKHMSKEAK